MKKSLIALAVLGSFAAAAQAQNVTLYGTIGQSVEQTELNKAGITANSNSLKQVTRQSTEGDYLSSSVIGIRGFEDLGKGLKATFQLEGDLAANNGTVGASGTTLFNRQSWIGLGYDQATVKVGRLQDIAKTLYTYSFRGNLFDRAQGNTISLPVEQLGSRLPNSTELSGKVAGVGYAVAYSNNIAANSFASDGAKADNASASARDQLTAGLTYSILGADLGVAYINRGAIQSNVQNAGQGTAGTSFSATAPFNGQVDGVLVAAKGTVFGTTLGLNYINNKAKAIGAGTGFNAGEKFSSVQVNAIYPFGSGYSVEGNVFASERKVDAGAASLGFTGQNTINGAGKTKGLSYGVQLVKDFSVRTAAYVGVRQSETKPATGDKLNELTYVVGAQHKF